MSYHDGMDDRDRAIWDAAEAEGHRKGVGCGFIVAALFAFVWTLIVRWFQWWQA
jgi:hypothetical protein